MSSNRLDATSYTSRPPSTEPVNDTKLMARASISVRIVS